MPKSLVLGAIVSGVLAPMQQGIGAQSTIDVLGVYPDHVGSRLADPKAAFVRNIEYANQALANSGADYRYNLVHVEQQNWASDDRLGSAQLFSLASDANIRALREEYGADIVAGMVPTSNGLCGIGYLPPANSGTHQFYSYAKLYAYSLSGDTCGGRTMAHEMGHNMGLGHSPAQGSKGTVATWGRGWGRSGSFVTLMAYESAYGVYSSSGRLQIHSNPSLSVCNGNACGQPSNFANGADATQALNLAAPQIEQWLDSLGNDPQNNAPTAVNDSATTDAGTPVQINVLANDSDPDGDAIAVSVVGTPAQGTAVANTARTAVTYTPASGFSGQDSFTYTIRDSRGATDQASVAVTVNAPPAAGGDDDGNLVVNGGGELGLNGWNRQSLATLATSSEAREGSASIQVGASARSGASVDIKAPIEASKYYEYSASLWSANLTPVYVYLIRKQGGTWIGNFVTARMLRPGQWNDVQATRYLFDYNGQPISEARLFFYFPVGTPRSLIDRVVMQVR